MEKEQLAVVTRIVCLFSENTYPSAIEKEIQLWLMDRRGKKEKHAALWYYWNSIQKKPDRNTRRALKRVKKTLCFPGKYTNRDVLIYLFVAIILALSAIAGYFFFSPVE